MHISGLHQFDNTVNSGNLVAAPRTYNPDGSPAALLMDLATFGNLVNSAGGQMQMAGSNEIKNLKNDAKATFQLKDHKDGLFTKIENT